VKLSIEKTLEVCSQLSQNPSVAQTDDGDLLLLHTNVGDCMAGCMMTLRRSTDGGLTWSEPERTIESDMELGGVEGTLSSVDEERYSRTFESPRLSLPNCLWFTRESLH